MLYFLEESCARIWIEQKQENVKGRAIDVNVMGRICKDKVLLEEDEDVENDEGEK